MALQAKNGGVLGYVGNGLERAIVEYLHQISEVPEEIRGLVTKVNRIVAVMKDAEQRPISSHEVRLWLQEAKQVLLDAEDLFDELATDAAVQKMRADTQFMIRFMLLFPAIPTRTRAIRLWIQGVNDMLDLLTSRTPMFAHQISTVPDSASGLPTWRETSSLLPDDASVIGRDREKDQIIQILLSSDDQLVAESSSNSNCFSLLSIVGLGGVGKTTLAQLVFNDPKVKEHFDLMMWVCVSHDADLRRVAKDMIEAALVFNGNYEQYQVPSWDLMQRRLHQEVKGKIFLLVLDDVWEEEHSMWEELFKPLRSGKKGSMVLVTARNMAFVSKLERRMVTPTILLGGLSDADSWVVLKKYAFRGNMDADVTTTAEYSHLEDLGSRHIVPRLKGSPLAARTIGSLLNLELSEQHWKTVLESEFWKLPQGENDILPALLLSYQYLRADLKQCFAYCSLIPKDYKFSKEAMVELWEAQSFIRVGRGEIMETMGSKYFDELLHMSFFEPPPRPSDENLYVMHDLIHDLAEYVSKDDCFRLEDQNIVNIPDIVHHMSVYVSERGKIDTINKLCFHKKLRTLLIQTRFYIRVHLNTRDLNQLFLKLKMLRVLRLTDCGITELPDSIGDLKHLRYIALVGNGELTRLPESLGNLYNLQILNLKFCDSLDVLPSTMCQLVNLRYFPTHDYNLVSSVDGLGKLTSLRELAVMGRKVRELGGMCMLRKLKVYNLEEVGSKEEASQARLHTMEHLQVLWLCWFEDRDITSTELDEEVLQAMRPSDGIRELHIGGYGGISSPDWMEASIPNSFSSLRSVSLSHLPSWQVPPCSFLSQLRHLEYLEIENCKNLVSLPEKGFGHLVSLKRLKIKKCPKLTCLLQEDEVGSSQHLPFSLEELEIKGCGDAMGGWWWAGLQRLTSIAKLSLRGCPTTAELLFRSLGRHHHPHLPVTLRELEIGGYNKSAETIRAFTSLEELRTPNFLKKWEGLYLQSSLDQECLSTCLPDLISLKKLTLQHLRNLRSLPNLSGLTSLETLRIKCCPSLQSWPTNGLPSSLQTLDIWRCPALTWEHRALSKKKKTWEHRGKPKSMWPKVVAHIPTVVIDGFIHRDYKP